MKRMCIVAMLLAVAGAASLCAEEARASDCDFATAGIQNPFFQLGITNSCDSTTYLQSNTNDALEVTALWQYGVRGTATPPAGVSGAGVWGRVIGGAAGNAGVEGLLDSTSPAATAQLGQAAGVRGLTNSTTHIGPGVYGLHTSSQGASPGVYGETWSNADQSAGVIGEVSRGSGNFSAGVRARNLSVGSQGVGLWASHDGSGYGTYSTSVSGTGVYGLRTSGSGTTAGVEGETYSTSANAVGVRGTVTPSNPGAGSAAVRGVNNGTGGLGLGVWGSQNGAGYGVYGTAPNGIGVVGVHEGTSGTNAGVRGETNSTAALAIGVEGRVNSSTPGPGSVGVRGVNNGGGGSGVGVWGFQGGTGYGVYGQSGNGYGVVGDSPNWAGYFFGNVTVTGTLFKGAGAFKIDHPLDPAHKYLQHSFVESPDMMDVYNGNVTTDGKGFAVVRLPGYFQALNGSFRYQLTSLSGLQNVAVAKEIAHNRFTIQSEKPHSRVSWQVTGIRHDPYAKAHRIQVVSEKPAAEQGRYLAPELYGRPLSKRVGVRLPAPPTRR